VSARTTLGVVRTSRKPDEHRLPIHPAHVARIDPALRERILLEEGYGERFGVTDEELAPLVAGLLPRDRLLAESDIVLLPKPQASDLAAMHPGQVLWGWPHCVQDPELTQLAIDRRLTVIAWEAMNHWTREGHFSVHVFHKNNELAGYCSVLHALSLIGVSGDYGRRLDAAVISFGATARGAVRALSALGIHEVAGLTQRETAAVASPMASVDLLQFEADEDDPSRLVVQVPDGPTPMPAYLARHDLVVNCVFQDTEAPLMFVTEDDLPAFARGSLIVDVSCDEGMGFSWAHPTSFAEPLREVGHGVHYYAVDHSPSWLWNSATWEISDALAPYLPIVMGGEQAWDADVTVRRAIEIRDGVVVNPRILSFQGRAAEYPHPRA
jgi:alanine dehydrogenase